MADGNGSERRELDAYFTTPALATALLTRIQEDGWWLGGRVLEPSAGAGAFVDAALSLKPQAEEIMAVDIDEARVEPLAKGKNWPRVQAWRANFLDYNGHGLAWDLVVGNPPYSEAEKHVRHALSLRTTSGVVAFLLRMGFLESEERAPFWREHPASKVYVLSQRPSFTGNGKTDRGQSYGFFVWATWHRGPTELEVLSWREPVRRAKP